MTAPAAETTWAAMTAPPVPSRRPSVVEARAPSSVPSPGAEPASPERNGLSARVAQDVRRVRTAAIAAAPTNHTCVATARRPTRSRRNTHRTPSTTLAVQPAQGPSTSLRGPSDLRDCAVPHGVGHGIARSRSPRRRAAGRAERPRRRTTPRRRARDRRPTRLDEEAARVGPAFWRRRPRRRPGRRARCSCRAGRGADEGHRRGAVDEGHCAVEQDDDEDDRQREPAEPPRDGDGEQQRRLARSVTTRGRSGAAAPGRREPRRPGRGRGTAPTATPSATRRPSRRHRGRRRRGSAARAA